MTAIDELRLPETLERTPDVEPRARKLRVIRRRTAHAVGAGAARGWLWLRSVRHTLPGIGGMAAVSAGVAGIVDYAFPGIGWWVFALAGGLFALVVDHRMP